jgi:hypothetical protein
MARVPIKIRFRRPHEKHPGDAGETTSAKGL